MPFSTNFANAILECLFAKRNALSVPSSVYIALCSNDPEADGGTFTELSGNGYARVLISQVNETYPDVIALASGRAITNSKQINWAKATGDWATARGFGLFTASSGGTPIFYGKLEEPVTCEAGAVALFDPNTLKISFPTTDVTAAAE